MIIICDLDGTICNCKHRIKLAEEKRWDEFNSACINDNVYNDVANILRRMHTDTETEIVLVSGRSDDFLEQTKEWLTLNEIPYDRIYMRAQGDKRSDDIVKREILKKNIKKSEVWFVLDDRKSVVNMWRDEGLRCLQVQEGDF
tara:strand:- start:1549 stop:1977 length:429 start_codon:yes stop_codon:yes gene_type:complete